MGTTITNNRLILKNTIMLYIRQIMVMAVGLYSSRIVLHTLGNSDYGVYNVVGGIVTIMGFLSSSMTTICSRFYACDIAKEDDKHLNVTFNTAVMIYIIITLIIVAVSETAGIWMVNNVLVIPGERMGAAKWVFQFSVITFILTVLYTPFRAMIGAYERMEIYALVSIFECMAKFILILLLRFLNYDKLILYGMLMTFVTLLVFCIYIVVFRCQFRKIRFCPQIDTAMFKEMMQFVSWNMISSISGAVYNQGSTILINMFFGPVINTAKSIASQVNGNIITFAGHFTSASQPQIIKNYAIGDYKNLYIQLYRGIKMTFVLMYIFTVPVCLKLPVLLRIWLGDYPEYTVIFTELTLISTCVEVTFYLLDTTAQASGKIKMYQLVAGIITLCIVPVTYVCFQTGAEPYVVLAVYIIFIIISMFAKLLILRKTIRTFSIRNYMIQVVVPIILLVLISLSLIIPVSRIFIPDNFIGIIEVSVLSVVVIGSLSFLLLLNKEEQHRAVELVGRRLQWKK